MELTLDEKVLVALYNATVKKGYGGYRISDLMPEGSTSLVARGVATRLQDQGYISIPQKMSASPIIFITDEGYKKAQSLMQW